MNAKDGKCFLCLEKANDLEISVCKDCVSTLICKKGTCFKRHEEVDCDGNVIQLESLTIDGNISKDRTLNGSCENDYCAVSNKSIAVSEIQYTPDTEVNFCSKCEGRRTDLLKDHKDLLNHNWKTALETVNKLMDDFHEKELHLNNKICSLNLTLDRNNEEIEEIKATIQTTTLQLKMLITDQESTLLSCLDSYFSEVTRRVTQQKHDLQSALEEVNESIEITREMLLKKSKLKQREFPSNNFGIYDDDDFGIYDDKDDVRSVLVPGPPNQRLVPDSFNYLMSLEGQLGEPVGVTSTPEGLVYVSDYNNDCIQVFDLTGQFVGALTHITTDTGRQTPFLCPTGLACDKRGNLVIAERGRHRIAVTATNGKLKYKFGKMGKAHSQLRDPHGVTVDRRGRIVVADTSNSRIQVYDKNGDFIFAFGNTGEEKLDYPTYVVFHKGLFLVSDTDNDAVKVYNKNGDYLRRLSHHPEGVFSAPSGLAIYQDDYVLVCDYNNDCVKLFSLDGNFISKFGSEGHGPGQFCGPEAVTVLRDNKVIVTDKNNSRVQIFA